MTVYIKGYENLYTISRCGEVLSLRSNVTLKPWINNSGYYLVHLCSGNGQKTFNVHRLVADHFIFNIENGHVINHKNGIKTDNRVENLEWVSQSENQSHAYRIGLKSSAHQPRSSRGQFMPPRE